MYFLLKNLGYDGISITTYTELPEAQRQYNESIGDQYIYGAAIINGNVVSNHNFTELMDDNNKGITEGELI